MNFPNFDVDFLEYQKASVDFQERFCNSQVKRFRSICIYVSLHNFLMTLDPCKMLIDDSLTEIKTKRWTETLLRFRFELNGGVPHLYEF